jgi:hypothetical protein
MRERQLMIQLIREMLQESRNSVVLLESDEDSDLEIFLDQTKSFLGYVGGFVLIVMAAVGILVAAEALLAPAALAVIGTVGRTLIQVFRFLFLGHAVSRLYGLIPDLVEAMEKDDPREITRVALLMAMTIGEVLIFEAHTLAKWLKGAQGIKAIEQTKAVTQAVGVTAEGIATVGEARSISLIAEGEVVSRTLVSPVVAGARETAKKVAYTGAAMGAFAMFEQQEEIIAQEISEIFPEGPSQIAREKARAEALEQQMIGRQRELEEALREIEMSVPEKRAERKFPGRVTPRPD